MAYAAVVAVAQILDQLLNTDGYPVEYPRSEVEYLYGKVCSLQSSLDKLSPLQKRKSRGSDVEELESQIRDVMYKAQDTIELFISKQISSSAYSDENSTPLFLQKLGEIAADVDLLTKTAEEIGENIIYEKTSNFVPSRSSSAGRRTKIFGLEEDRVQLIEALWDHGSDRGVILITGSAGTGKTTLSRIIYEDPLIIQHFDILGWVTVSVDNNIRDIVSILLFSISSHNWSEASEEERCEILHKMLFGRRYLIVIDDIWDPSVWERLRVFLPDNGNGSGIIITSRNDKVASGAKYHHVMHPLDEERSWELLCENAFGGGGCAPHLENIGRNIAHKCGGIALSIVVVGGLLSQGPNNEEYWKTIAADIYGAASVSEESYLDILYLSYKNLPSRLRACFLYMAAFQEDAEIPVAKLINLWVAEGFLTSHSPPQTSEQVAKQHLEDLIHRNLISIRKISSDGQPKTCSMQGNLRQVAMQECRKEDFFYAVKKHALQLPEGAENQRRISIHNNILLCSEDVYRCTKSIEHARTLLYAGPNHFHPLPLCLTFELLRVLDALSVYFVELPDALFELIHLRYLAFTYDEDLPHSIANLRNLLILTVRQHPKIMFRCISFLPAAIWNLPQIRHLMFPGSFLPDPSKAQIHAQCSLPFKNLQSLSNVNVACCTKEILQNMPNLKKLGTWIEEPVAVEFDLDQLQHLESFKLTVLKPIPGHKIEFRPKIVFPKTLRKMSLSGCGLPWEDMAVIAELPHLQVLKLRELAFQGQQWIPDDYIFERLEFLLLESLNLEAWDFDVSNFPVLRSLIIRHCYQLKEINSDLGFSPMLEIVEMVDCNPSAVKSVECIREEQETYGNTQLEVHIYSSWK